MNLKLYSYFRSSASYRVRIALGLKKLNYEYIPVHLLKNGGEQRSDKYKTVTPTAKVPTLVHGDFSISESVAIVDYLESIQPEPPLFPKDAKKRAEIIRFCEVINSGIQPLQNLSVNQYLEAKVPSQPDLKNEWNKHWIASGLEIVESLLSQHAGTYAYGNSVTAADCFLIPQVFASKRFGVDLAPFPNIRRVSEACESLEAFKKAHPSVQPDAE